MQVEYHLDPETRLAIITVAGDVTFSEFESIIAEIRDQPEYWQASRLWDIRESSFSLTRDEVRKLADVARSGPVTDARVAVVTGDGEKYEVARVFEIWRGDASVAIRVLKDYDEALRWLQD